MLLKSDTVHDAWAATQRTVGVKLTIKETEYDASDITSLTFDSGAMNGEALTLGSTYQNTIKVVFSRLIEGLALTDEITPELGIKLPDGTWDYTPLGVFVIDAEVQQDRNNNTTTISASDRMCMMGGTYKSKLTYPAAINDIAIEVANLAAVKINDDDFARLPTDKVANFGSVTYRDAIGYVAQFAGGFATFDRDGLLDIRQLADPNFDVAPSQYQSKGLTKNEALYRIGGIACTVTTTTKDDSGNETQDTKTLQSGSSAGTQITISNPGMTQDLLDGLYEQLQDLNFYPFSLSWFGDPNVEAGDWIEVQDTAGNKFKTPNLLYALTFSGGITATSKADTTVSASASFVYKGQLSQIVNNIRQYLNASGHAVSEGIDEPSNPKAGDIWFKKDGPDTTIMTYVVDPETGIGSWVEEVSTKGVTGLDEALKKAKAQLDADIAAAKTDLAVAKQDVADLQVKLKANDDTQAQLSKDLAANSNLITQNKADVDKAMATVNDTLSKAQADTAAAVKNADEAVANAKSSAEASGLATTTANAANDAATAAKNLATSTANSFATVQSQASTAASDAATALDQAKSAIGNATDALNKVNGISVGGTNLLTGTSNVQDYTLSGSGWANGSQSSNGNTASIPVTPGASYTYSAIVKSTTFDCYLEIQFFDSGKKWISNSNYNPITGIGARKIKAVAPENAAFMKAHMFFKNAPDSQTVVFNSEKLEKGSVATDWSPAPEDVQIRIDKVNGELSQKVSQTTYNTLAGTVDTVNTLAKQNQSTITTLATQTSVDAVNQTVTTTKALAEQTANGLTLKADSSTVDTINDTVKQQGIDLKAAQGELKLKLTQSDLTKGLDGYATQSWAQNQITVTATELNSTLETVQTQIQNSAVGTNLVTGTSEDFVIDDTANTGTNGWIFHAFNLTQQPKVGDKITVSAEGTLTGKGDLSTYEAILYDSYTSVGRSNPKRLTAGEKSSATLEVTSLNGTGNTVLLIYAGNISDTAGKKNVIHHLKAEFGSVATDWCLNPSETATVTALSKLSQTVDGLTGTFATKNDLATTATNLKLTADGLNLITAVTGTKGENVTQVIADVKNIKTTMTGANGYTTRLQTLEGFQTTATSDITGLQASQTLLSSQWTSAIGSPNLVYNSSFVNNLAGWTNKGNSTYSNGGWAGEPNGIDGIIVTSDKDGWWGAESKKVPATVNALYSMSAKICIANYTYSPKDAYIEVTFFDSSGARITAVDVGVDTPVHEKWNLVKNEGIVSPTGTDSISVAMVMHGAGKVKFEQPILVQGESVGPYRPDSISGSQITQLQNQIDLRTTVAGKVTAALNLSNDGGGTVTIRGASLYVTAASHFDAASIQSAAIAGLAAEKITSGSIAADRLATTNLNADNITSGSIAADLIATTALSATNIISGTLDVGKLTVKNLSADMIASGTIDASKITVKNLSASNIIGGELDAGLVNVKNLNATNIITGTLNAGLLNVIGLNASAISAGTITGANLAINLNTGTVTFQSGQIHSTTDNIDINIDKGYMSVADRNSRVLLKGGQLQFVQPQLFDLQTTPYLSISNDGVGSNWAGATIVGRDSIMLANSANVGSSIMTWEIGQNTFSGLISGKNSDGDWDPTIVGGAERGVVIVGGPLDDGKVQSSPYLRVGASTDGHSVGNRIYMHAAYIIAPAIYTKTTGSSSNVVVLNDGSLHRSTSASKYKTMIERSRSTSMAEALISLPTAHWLDKAELSHYASGEQKQAPTPYFGMIAEDLAAAGLEDLVQRGDTGELEGINYDRIAPALLPLLAQMKQEIEELKSAAKSA